MTKIVHGLDESLPADALFINVPLWNYDVIPREDYEVLPPLGIGYLATYAQFKGFNVGVIDAEAQGLGFSEIIEAVKKCEPRFVGINVLTPVRPVALKLIALLPQDITLLIGAMHSTALPQDTVTEFSEIHPKTILFVSEAEIAVTKIISGKKPEDVPGVCWIEDNQYRFTPGSLIIDKLDEVPFLDRKFLPNDPHVDRRTGMVESIILSSRGCPFTCTYCAGSRKTLGTPIRKVSAYFVAQEIAQLQEKYGVKAIRFIDDLMIISERRVRSIMDELDRLGVHVMWDATGRADIMSRFSSEFYDYMVDHGLHEVAIGIESGAERIRKQIHKQVDETQIWTTVQELIKRNVMVKGYLIVGLPSETAEETAQTFDLARRLMQFGNGMFRASIFLFRPYPGTEEWARLIELGWTQKQLLQMETGGIGERAKHTVTTNHQYAELDPILLNQMITNWNEEQELFISSKE
jgi:anaerobic magnesium-protoporphyrin IX monomethyl ester cyclase